MQVFKNLEELKIDLNFSYTFAEHDLLTIMERDLIGNLKVLDVSGCASLNLSSLFSENSKVTKLEKLIIDQARVSLSSIANWKYASHLTYLSASDCSFTDQDFELLVAPNSNLCNLTYLNIQKSFKYSIDNMKEVKLSETLNFTQLKSLRMGWNMFSPFAISPRVKFNNMITLDMSGLKIGEKAFKSVIRNQSLKSLENLTVRECRLGWEFIEALVNPTINCLKSLKTLKMNDNKISNKGMILLSNSKLLSQLTIIELDINFIGIEGATSILENYEKFKHLKYISLKNNNFGKKLLEFRECNISNAIVDDCI
ncbi:predicted protein [Naegleria gruberi]|uniref:Predicted protein n=1 Tax=Naegleria gruberi TaxID=5762 RepID=D2VPF9_NAEGR|nr:uncharacterized protein NAEGRDRAFT_70846 [Naegleria gruberi]EFC41424.1 predicted protein [Naegleria gruberi]|eukprot:XP_002674168.1 predicted protein [Naegleria gruberi strain NEG-M]